MAGIKVILFDLDGTLSDPGEGITKSVQFSLSKLGIHQSDLKQLEVFVGPPLQSSFPEYYGFDEETTRRAVEYYRERFQAAGMFENVLYPEIDSLLKSLKEQKYILAVATSKPTIFAEKILKHFNIRNYFDFVAGSNLDGSQNSKEEIINYVLGRYPDYHKSEFIMVGDRKHDLIGASLNGIQSIGVTYGYGTHDELIQSKADIIVHSVDELKTLFSPVNIS